MHPADLGKALKTLASKHKYVANKFAFNVNAGTPVVHVNIHSSDKRVGCKLSVDRHNRLTAGLCKAAGSWIPNLRRRMTVSEMETLPSISTGRLAWPKGITQSMYSGTIGNASTAGVIGRFACTC